MPTRILCLLFVLLWPPVASGHGVRHSVETTDAVVITVTHEDGSPLTGATYKVSSPAAAHPEWTGTTDRRGRVIFVPDLDGDWRVEVWSPDGHGFATTIPWTANDGTADTMTVPIASPHILVGVVVAALTGFLVGRRQHRT